MELPGTEVLAKLNQLDISTWSYKKDQPQVKHIGPMAEDFYALFNIGVDNKSISSIDTSGVALPAIKALNQKVAEIDHLINENKKLKNDKDTEITMLKVNNLTLLSRLEAIEPQLAQLGELKTTN